MRGLGIVRAHGARLGVANYLEGFAKIGLLVGQHYRAAYLSAAAHAARDKFGTPIPPVERPEYDRSVSQLRAQLDAVAVGAAWAEGLIMSWEQAAVHALET